MYVYRTSGFDRKAERYGITDRIDDFCAELQTQRIDEVQARFERLYPYLKRRILNQRLVARIFKVDCDQILCLLDIFKRGDNDYEKFLEAPAAYGRTHLEPQLDLAAIREWLAVAKIESNLTQELPELPPIWHPWLETPDWQMEQVKEDWAIYESEEWVRRFATAEIQDDWETYYRIVSQINSNTASLSQPVEADGDRETAVITFSQEETQLTAEDGVPIPNHVKLYGENERYVLYSQVKTTDSTLGGVLFLLAPFPHLPSSQDIAEVGNKTALFNEANTTNILSGELHLCELTPFAQRSYPAYLLADEESWLAIERGKEANLALSPEEEQILHAVSTSVPGDGALPLFINGRAGSGKSTMLIYLFADYCYRKYYNKQGRRRREPLPGELLFLTYNERLLEVARDGVKRLLSSHHRFLAERSQSDEIPNIDRCFQPFGKFLLSLLPPQESDRFNPENYISFHRFKLLYQGQSPTDALSKAILHLPQARRYSPEMCWHVIRTFIKGYGQQEFMTPEDYQEEVPRKERSIDLEKFQGIYDTIWERWYKRLTTEQGYWDDQDLIARVLALKCYRPEYTAIFCDEAQDFTRLELQLIMRLSLFSQYNLGYQPIRSLPFAFAGDPFQTLNPTGFHWSSVQAAFDSEVITAIDPAEQLKLAINFQELAFNYRSSPSIVQFTNLIQLWRHVLFNIPELQPQTAWHPGSFSEPQKFILNQNINAAELATYIKDTIIIVPCEEGEETAYASTDEVLSKILPQLGNSADATNNQPIKNILSAIAAKGLEFKKVILYKFGEDCNHNVWNLQGIDQKVKVEYFFNKLYVAASRATEYLFVVDTEKGDRQLWQYASDEALLQAMLGYAKNKDRWEDKVTTISPGTPKTVRELREEDPGAIALEFETKGLSAENPDLLRRAQQFYSDLGDSAQADSCEAWALKFEGCFREAGSRFLLLEKAEEAWHCFWEGMCWPELVAWYKLYPERQTLERSFAFFMVALPQDLEAVRQFTSLLAADLLTDVTDDLLWSIIKGKQGAQVLAEYVHRIKELLNNPDLRPHDWQQFGNVLVALELGGYSGIDELIGDCCYRAANYEQALHYWEAAGVNQTPEYNLAQAKLLGMPAGLEHLAEAGEHDSILAEWEQAGKPRDRNWLTYVALALETKGRYQQAFVLGVWLDDLVKVKDYFERASHGKPVLKLFTVLLQYLFRKKYWLEAIEAFEKYLPAVVCSPAKKAALKFDIVFELATSELEPDDLTKEQRQHYENFIKEQILSTSDWQQHLLMQQVGIALEKLGVLVETLSFYEQFVTDPDPELRQFARERWMAMKKKQEDYARNQGKLDRANKNRLELLKKANSWQIAPDSIPPIPPPAPKERPSLPEITQQINPGATAIFDEQSKDTLLPLVRKTPTPEPVPTDISDAIAPPIIKGLPTGTTVEQLKDGIVSFAVLHLVVKVMKQAKQVLITDVLTTREVRVDWELFQVNIGEATVTATKSKQLSFAMFVSGYSAVLIGEGNNYRLELDVQGCASKIAIELTGK
ncbi:MAG TPA: hypothetical protein DDZ80_17285 [Cyanobacteria bacterium UBA8803]|nr:hypothetical protein [Cyanobacteria bacterium UBA9273]HBL60150.1 hypothetical protein [Cyanobacteria bacterium UBA8803]